MTFTWSRTADTYSDLHLSERRCSRRIPIYWNNGNYLFLCNGCFVPTFSLEKWGKFATVKSLRLRSAMISSFFSFTHFLSRFSSQDCGVSNPRRTRNTSWFSAISYSSTGSTQRRDQTRWLIDVIRPPGAWPTYGPLSRGCSQQDLPCQYFLGHSQNQRSWDLSVQRRSGSTFKALGISQLSLALK